jgi:hypothetical protein
MSYHIRNVPGLWFHVSSEKVDPLQPALLEIWRISTVGSFLRPIFMARAILRFATVPSHAIAPVLKP